MLSAQCQTSGTGPRYPSLLGKSLERVINGECSSCYSGRAFPEAGPRGTRPKPTGRKTQSWVSGTRRAPSTSFLRVQTSARAATETQTVVYCECRRRSQCGRAGPGGRTRAPPGAPLAPAGWGTPGTPERGLEDSPVVGWTVNVLLLCRSYSMPPWGHARATGKTRMHDSCACGCVPIKLYSYTQQWAGFGPQAAVCRPLV